MSFLLACPNCGPRDVYEFRFQGEVTSRPAATPDAARADRLRLLPRQRRRVSSASGGTTASAAASGSSRSATRARTRSLRTEVAAPRLSAREPGRQPDRRADRPLGRTLAFAFEGRPCRGFAGDTIGSAAVRGRPPRLLAELQVPPAARAPLLLGQLPQLHDDRRRRPERARLRRAGARGRGRARAERASARSSATCSRSSTTSAARSRRSASTTAR